MGSIDPQVAIPDRFDVTLPVTDEIRQQIGVGDVVAFATTFVVDDAITADLANRELRSTKDRLKKLDDARKSLIAPARQIIESAQLIFKPAIDALTEAEGIYKAKLTDWSRREEERLACERREREAAERLARQKAEQAAAAARARAEAEAAEARRKAQEAEEARRKAEAEGNARAAAAAAAEAAKLQEKAAAAEENGAAKAQAAILSAAAQVAPEPVAVATPKGFSTRDNWVAELASGQDEGSAKAAIVAAIAAGRADLLGLLVLDMSAASKLAKALKSAMNVPGLVAVNKPVAASRK